MTKQTAEEEPSECLAPAGVGRNYRRSNRVLFLCNFLSKGWEVSILGFLVFIVKAHSLPLYTMGLLSAVFLVSQISISFFAGKIAHAVHSRNVIFLSIGASGLSWLTLFFAAGLPALFLAYMFGGISSGLFEPIGNSLVAKSSASRNRGTTIGNFAAMGDMGRIVVFAAATALAGLIGVTNACAVLLGSTVVVLILALVFMANGNGADSEAAEEAPIHLKDLLKNGGFRFATAAGIADSFSSASLYIFIPVLLETKGIDLANTLYFNIIFFAGYMSGRLGFGRLADRYGTANVLIASKIAMAILLLLLILTNGRVAIICLLFLLGAATRGSSPIIRAMVADSMDDGISFHNAFSVFSSASRGSSALSRPIYGFLTSYAGIAYVFYMASAVSLCTLYPAVKYKKF